VSLVAALALAQAAVAAEPLSMPAGYRLVWSDEFSRPGLPDPRRWDYDTEFNRRGWHNEERQYYSARRLRNARVRRGRLIVEARAERLDPRRFPDWGGQAYSSARLVTRGRASWTYGFFEVRAKLACGRGVWPAIWMLGASPGLRWPEGGEIDIMEHVGHEPGIVHQTVHTGALNHASGTHRSAQARVPDPCGAFHAYQLDWTRERIRMGIDGRTVFTFPRSDDPARWPFDGPQYLILNVAIGGTWGGAQGIDEAALPARMEVDYVRVWQAQPRARLDLAHQHQDQEDDDDDAEQARRAVAPAAAVAPSRQRANQENDQDDEKDRSDAHVSSSLRPGGRDGGVTKWRRGGCARSAASRRARWLA
jgi:beta-glucanase (GH16 family)